MTGMFSFFNKVTTDPPSGRPIAPISGGRPASHLVLAWLNGLTMLFCEELAVRDKMPVFAVALVCGALFVVISALGVVAR